MTDHPSLTELAEPPFHQRHIGPNAADQSTMLTAIGRSSLADLMDTAIPPTLRSTTTPHLPAPASEAAVLAELRKIAKRNQLVTPMIGLGYYATHTPSVIRRNILENPAWYTAYTPYQPEIAQGRLEALLNFQTVVADLTALPIANASLLDEATAAAEAMALARRASHAPRDAAFAVDADVFPQTRNVIATRATALGIKVLTTDLRAGLPDGPLFGVLAQYPGASGRIDDHAALISAAHERGALVAIGADLLALTLLRPPGEIGADIAVGTSQRFGVPLGFGGPHAGYIAVTESLQRALPGRLVGVSRDAAGQPVYRLALQTREQHIRREKATSNICTAQALPAIMAGMYAVWHGAAGLRQIALRTHRNAAVLAAGLRQVGAETIHGEFFDTVLARVPDGAAAVLAAARERGINLRLVDDDHLASSCDETTTPAHLHTVWESTATALSISAERSTGSVADYTSSPTGSDAPDVSTLDAIVSDAIPSALRRSSPFLTHPVFRDYHSETAMLRYLRRLADADYALDRGMIPLGSCTMKLNAATEMEPITWPEFAELHPFAPADQAAGYHHLIDDVERWLAAITGYDAVSVQPNAGSQGELAGLLAIRRYLSDSGQPDRDICLIPSSAHGTNAASASLAGLRSVVVACDGDGNIDLAALRRTIADHGPAIAAMMITYPSTHGVYEPTISEVCAAVHEAGGQVYVDGANLNALIGYAQPGKFGADVSHLNLHKTFCIPHGGGGPGVGPVAARSHLAPYLPGDPLADEPSSPVAAARYGSAGVLPISWAYIRLMGADGLTAATGAAVLAANYLAKSLSAYYPVLYTGAQGLVAHECIIDLRPLTKLSGVTVEDVAKRLMDYGFHAPTVAFPVAGTLMVEPTESENLAELDRFVEAMAAIRAEIDRVVAGEWPTDDNPLRNAPHTAAMLTEEWEHPYDRELAVYPTKETRRNKYWPPVRRIDNAYGDRNIMCSCPPPSAFDQA